MNWKSTVGIAVAIAAIAAGVFWLVQDEAPRPIRERAQTAAEDRVVVAPAADKGSAARPETLGADADSAAEVDAAADSAEELSAEEKQAAAEEKSVEDFDAATDRWMDADNTRPPTLKEVDEFRDKFKRVPKARREECLQRALNLIPDENVLLLVGILLDKSEDPELVQLVYNDVLNRDESVKRPVLQEIYKDKEHSCWADTAWILDVTDELPKTSKAKDE